MKYRFLLFLLFVLNLLSAQSVDSFAIRQVDSLLTLNRDLVAKKQFEEALVEIQKAEKLTLSVIGRESAMMGKCLHNHARTCQNWGKSKEAEPLYLEAIAIREKVLGKEHPDYAWSLSNLGNIYQELGNYKKAETLYLEIKAIREKVLGKDHLDYANSLNNLAILYYNIGKYEKAEPLYLEAKAIQEKMLGKEHPDYASSLGNLAALYQTIGNYEKAEPLQLASITIREKVLGKEHPDYARSLNWLAILYQSIGQYEKAEPLYLEAKAIWEKALGKEHPDYAGSLINLANLYCDLGNYQKAEILYLEARNIFKGNEKLQENTYYINCLNNLATFYSGIGNYEKAEPLYLEAKDTFKKVLGKEHPDYAGNLINLADLYSGIGNYQKAELLYLEAKNILEGNEKLREHPFYMNCLNNLAILYYTMGNYEKAEPLILESKAIREKVLGKEHPDYAWSLNWLAILYQSIGQYEKAEPLYLESKAIWEKVLGKDHPDYAGSLYNLAELYHVMGTYEKAVPISEELILVNQSLLEKASRHLSERELGSYLNGFSKYQAQAFSIAQKSINKTVVSACFDNALFYKGFLLNASNQVKHLALSDSTSSEKYNLLKSYERRLAAQYASLIAERDSASIADLEVRANDLEKELTRTVAGFGEAQRQVNWQEVQQVLKPDEASIEFVHYRYSYKKQTDSTMYAALLLRPGKKQPSFIPLFEEKSLDSLLHSRSERRADYVNSLYTLADRGVMPVEAPKKSLYEILWMPLEKELTGIKTIYFSPSGLLHRINLDAIPVSETETLADRYNLIELNSTRQLVIPTKIKNINNDAVLFGGIQYEQDTALQNNEPLIALQSRGEVSFNYVDSTLRGGSWNYLAGTEREVNSIEKLMQSSGIQTNLKNGYKATEASFKNIGANNAASPRILHIATHGYFFPDPKSSEKKSNLNGELETVFKISDHPMLRSGLIMAGGNAAWQGKQPLEGREDGILTAYEISQMNLSNTELVVLSACETGLGDIQGNEGVYGLQRAFKIAGAKYLIMSLWQVPDKQTSLLMTTFYKKWLENKMAIPEAFHAAQKELRDNGLDPYNWAGFVLVE